MCGGGEQHLTRKERREASSLIYILSGFEARGSGSQAGIWVGLAGVSEGKVNARKVCDLNF